MGFVEFGKQAPRLVLHAHQIDGGGHQRQYQQGIDAGHAVTASAARGSRWATRMTALRARGLAAISDAQGLIRPSAFKAMVLGARQRGCSGRYLARVLGNELLDDAVFQ
jgi:hypothetical protein